LTRISTFGLLAPVQDTPVQPGHMLFSNFADSHRPFLAQKTALASMVGGIENEGESMPRTRKSRPPSLKAKVEVETIRAHKTAVPDRSDVRVRPRSAAGRNRRWPVCPASSGMAVNRCADSPTCRQRLCPARSDTCWARKPCDSASARCGSAGGRQHEHQAGEK
jgi:hypothetical protein